MSDKSNDEKIKILKERLNQINLKNNSHKESKIEDPILDKNDQKNKRKKTSKTSLFIKYFLIISLVGFGIFYFLNYVSIDQKTMINKKQNNVSNIEDSIINFDKIKWENLDIKGNYIAIIKYFKEEEIAKAYVSNLNIKGFKSNYFYLPEKSNNNQEIHVVYIGGYENIKETNQWLKNIEESVTIIKLNN